MVGALLERVDDLLVGDALALQVALHQRVRHFADLVHQLLAVLLRALRQRIGDRHFAPTSTLGRVLTKGLHVDQVDHSLDVVLCTDRDLRGDGVRAERALDLLQRAVEVGALAIEHVHEQHPRDVQLRRSRPQAAGRDLDAHHGVNDEHSRLAHAQRTEGVGDEARLARRVKQVDLAISPRKRAQRRRDRHLPRLLIGIGIRHRACVGNRAQPAGRPSLEQQRLVQRGLSRAAMADKGDVANPVRRLAVSHGSHAISSLAVRSQYRRAKPRARPAQARI